MKNAFVYRIAHDTSEARLTVLGVPDRSGIGAKIFHSLAEAKINVDMIIYNNVMNGTPGMPNVSFLIWKKDVARAREAAENIIQEIGATGIKIEEDIARITVIGQGLHNPSGIVAELFEAFGDEKINIQMISTSERRVSCLVKAADVKRSVKTLIEKFGLDDFKNQSFNESHEEVDFAIPLDAPFDYTLINA